MKSNHCSNGLFPLSAEIGERGPVTSSRYLSYGTMENVEWIIKKHSKIGVSDSGFPTLLSRLIRKWVFIRSACVCFCISWKILTTTSLRSLRHYGLRTHTACCFDVARFGLAQRVDWKNSAWVRGGCKSNMGGKPPIMEYLQGVAHSATKVGFSSP